MSTSMHRNDMIDAGRQRIGMFDRKIHRSTTDTADCLRGVYNLFVVLILRLVRTIPVRAISWRHEITSKRGRAWLHLRSHPGGRKPEPHRLIARPPSSKKGAKKDLMARAAPGGTAQAGGGTQKREAVASLSCYFNYITEFTRNQLTVGANRCQSLTTFQPA